MIRVACHGIPFEDAAAYHTVAISRQSRQMRESTADVSFGNEGLMIKEGK